MSEQNDLVSAGDAAAQIREDPAFAALEDSGAPIVAAAGAPPEIVYLNQSARAAFGADSVELGDRLFRGEEEGARRLAELAASSLHGAAPRLERLRFSFGPIAQTVTILCRKTRADEAGGLFLIAALGVRARPEAEPAPPAAPSPQPALGAEPRPLPSEPDAMTIDRPEPAPLTLVDAAPDRSPRPAGKPPRPERFLWRTDAEGWVVDVTGTLADVVGRGNGDIVGSSFVETARRLRLDPVGRLAEALASRRSWSGVELDWPLQGGVARVPVTLGALPIFDDARRFGGFQGYGVLHVGRLRAEPPATAESAAEPAPLPAPSDIAEAAPVVSAGAKIVPLRPQLAHSRFEEGGASPAGESLTPSERAAFEEISRALAAGAKPGKSPARELIEAVEQATGCEPPAAAEDLGSIGADRAHGLLDRLPVGVLVARGARALYANRTLLDYLGYADLAALAAEGGAARLFVGPRLQDADEGGASVLELRGRDGEQLDADARLQAIDWDGGPATLVTLRSARPSAGAAEAARLGALQTELARRRREAEELRATLEATDAAYAIVDRDGRLRSASRAFGRLLGEEADTLIGEPLASLFAESDRGAVADHLRRSESGADGLRTSTRARQGAAPASVHLTLAPLGADQKRCAVLRELEPRRGADEALEAARREAERANAAKTDFLAKVSHEVRTPLNAIIGFAEVMMEERFGPLGSERYKEYLKDIHTSGGHVLSLVNDLLDLSKIESGKMELDVERIDANAMIAECVSIMQPQANRSRVVIRLSLWTRLPRVLADGRSLRQILLNLLSNAVKFNEAGGQVIVSSALTDAGYVVIRVKDTGIGMSESEIETALEPFRQVGPHKASGAGLGLPVTKALIEANRASFSITSRKNGGTLVEVAFPPPQVLAAE
ncbi:histidine kinase dimerization/phospho-acceptor domain-containing protein [Methylosinus sp. Sm6]|uniref:histidine kinase dimerization/phospho-acceptor domain-containing protein n=1 Tax=Methylosinus sp. Sm6 TaxID=2866948 RepID=UPI001C99F8F6|nr:histidine kinase dimerization/phospho-acceptor domain-containing protein [Methylosinus sp. Sm6]MBY6243186.1 PAS domain-containing protein [Methylosinus sp. Sm6]